MKPALPPVWPPGRRHASAAAIAVALLFPTFAPAQNSQFRFDASGHLITQTAAALAPPQLLSQPQPQVVAPGQLASFLVVAASPTPLTYQWRFNDANLPGATNDALLLLNVSVANEGQYSVVLANSSGSVTSAPAALWLDADRDGLPDAWELAHFGSLNQHPTGDFDGDGVSNLDEFLDDTDPADSSAVRFRLTVLRDSGQVTVAPYRSNYTNGEMVTLTATAFAPDTFHGWFGTIYSTNNPVTISMTNHQTVFAYLGSYDMVWTNTSSGNWSNADNWDHLFPPGTNDHVTIARSVTVTLNHDAAIAGLTLGAGANPTLFGSGTLTVQKDSRWTGGVMSGSGRTVIPPEATLTIANPGSVSLTTRTLDNAGTVLWTGANLILNGASITNRPGALFETRATGTLSYNGGSPRFDNAGTFRKAVHAGTATISSGIAFHNLNTVEIQSGTLALAGGGTHTGTFTVPAGTTLALAGGTHNLTAPASITGGGTFTVSSGTANLAGFVHLTGPHNFTGGGIANFTGDYFVTNNTVTIAGGTANFSGTGTATPNAITLSSGTLTGSRPVTVLQQMNWTGGVMSGSGRTIIPPEVTLTIANPGSVSLTTRTLDNAGTVLWTGANLILNGTSITNRPGALFETRATGTLSYNGGSPRFDNAGTFRKAVHAGTASVGSGIAFHNLNTVEIHAGTLALAGGGTHTGTFTVPAGTTLALAGGTHNLTAPASITGGGTFTVSSGTADLAGFVHLTGPHNFTGGGIANFTGDYFVTNNTVTIAGGTANFSGTGTATPNTITLSSGTLTGSRPVTVLQQMNWTGGVMSGSGRTVIPPEATLTIANPGSVSLTTRTLDNAGTVLWTGANLILNGASITNRPGALFETRATGTLSYNGGSPRFDNAGTFRKAVHAGTATISSGIPFHNLHAVEIHAGTLAMNGGFQSTPNSVLQCAIGGTTVGSGYGRLQVAGAVTLNGTLRVVLTNGFIPAINDSFTILTAGTRTGTFANFYYPSNEVTMLMSNTANSVVVQVSEVHIVPQPQLLAPEIVGADLRLIWTATSNVTYQLEYNPDLHPTNWIPLPGNVLGVSNTASKLDLLTPTNRFYRVRVVP